MSYVFGPVPSRRLGRSLGVDVVPFKTCTYDCVYCQLGHTNCHTVERKAWAPLDELLNEVEAKLSTEPDYITLSGSGEPTLFSQLGVLIDGIKSMTDIPVALLTNGSLLWRPDVREDVANVDLLIPSLDAGDEKTFQLVNHPHAAVSFDKMIDGLVASRQTCRGEYWLEVLLLAGMTDTEAQVMKIVEHTDAVKPDRVQLNTVVRPPADSSAAGVSPERLTELARLFSAPTDVVADYPHDPRQTQFSVSRDEVLGLLRRRPCSIDGVAQGLRMHPNEAIKYLDRLLAEKRIETTWVAGTCYYRAVIHGSEMDAKSPADQ